MELELKSHIESASRIVVVSHISPDPDAVSSLVMMGTALKLNYPQKQVLMALEEEPRNLSFLHGYEQIEFGPLPQTLEAAKPDLLILLDCNNFDRCSRLEGAKVRQYVIDNSVKTAMIDHHEPAGADKADLYINQGSPAAAQDVFEILFEKLGLKQPDGAAQSAMLGIYADSGGFAYLNDSHSATFALADKLVSQGVSIEKVKNLLAIYSVPDMRVISELAANVTHQADFNYSFLSDEFIEDWLRAGHPPADLNGGVGVFVNDYIRNIEGRDWGFTIYKNLLESGSKYSVSLRSVGGTKDVSAIAAKLGGGGHKASAGARFEAPDIETAIAKVKQAISSA